MGRLMLQVFLFRFMMAFIFKHKYAFLSNECASEAIDVPAKMAISSIYDYISDMPLY